MAQRRAIQIAGFVYSPCPACKEIIFKSATLCYHCGESVDGNYTYVEAEPSESERELLKGPGLTFFLPSASGAEEEYDQGEEDDPSQVEKPRGLLGRFLPKKDDHQPERGEAAEGTKKMMLPVAKVAVVVVLCGTILWGVQYFSTEPSACEQNNKSRALAMAMEKGDTKALSKMTPGEKGSLTGCRKD
ncbi:MAG: hypothetical protein HQL52_02870 [Magnetococcales bacterium]|nr:hypothetical protein [Magnetococcales bacterium]